jgi:hypothetical protein
MRRVERRPRPAGRELQRASVQRRPAEPMPAAERTAAQVRLRQKKRQEKRQEKKMSVKIVACGFPAGFQFESCGAVVV